MIAAAPHHHPVKPPAVAVEFACGQVAAGPECAIAVKIGGRVVCARLSYQRLNGGLEIFAAGRVNGSCATKTPKQKGPKA